MSTLLFAPRWSAVCCVGTSLCMSVTKPGSLRCFGGNGINLDRLSPAERLSELAVILAAGLTRLRARQSSRVSGERENSFVDFTAHQSGHATGLEPVESGA